MWTEEYARGREAILRECLEEATVVCSKLEAEKRELAFDRAAFQQRLEILSNANKTLGESLHKLDMELRECRSRLGHADKKLNDEKGEFFKLLEWVMSIDNRSAEERLNSIRKLYKDEWYRLKELAE